VVVLLDRTSRTIAACEVTCVYHMTQDCLESTGETQVTCTDPRRLGRMTLVQSLIAQRKVLSSIVTQKVVRLVSQALLGGMAAGIPSSNCIPVGILVP